MPAIPMVLVAHGVNLDLLGHRESEYYGSRSLVAIDAHLKAVAPELSRLVGLPGCQLECFQSNSEADFLGKLTEKDWDGVVINPAAWTHTSLALADRLRACSFPYVEVHLSNLARRESFRQKSFTASASSGVVHGFGHISYEVALLGLLRIIASK